MEETSKKVRQREIKFRCFYNGKMYPVLELHGEDSMTVNGIKMHLDGLGERVVSPDSEHIKGVMQYTGLKDRTGKEIYEGDVVKKDDPSYWIDPDNKTTEEDRRLWQGGTAQVIAVPFGYHMQEINCGEWAFNDPEGQHWSEDEIEVIGNIYEHPHLLSQGEIKN